MSSFDLKEKRVWVAGHRGMAGAAIARRLASEQCEIVTAARSELDLLRQADVHAWMEDQKIDAVFLAAAKVGGIMANSTRPAEFEAGIQVALLEACANGFVFAAAPGVPLRFIRVFEGRRQAVALGIEDGLYGFPGGKSACDGEKGQEKVREPHI